MKKLFFVAVAALCFTSCSTSLKSASEHPVTTSVVAAATADLTIGPKITYTYEPSASVRRGGFNNVKAAAIAEALKANGGGDVLIESQEAVVIRKGLFGSKVRSVTVTGYVGTYSNFKKADAKDIVPVSASNSHKMKASVGLF